MVPILGFIEKHFRHPLVPIFLIFGAMLTLLGITSGVSLGGYGELETTGEFRYISIVMGFACITTAMIMYYNPVGDSVDIKADVDDKTAEIDNGLVGIPSEIALPWSARRDYLTSSQRRILSLLEEINQTSLSAIMEAFPDSARKEMFYRLEQLRLLGFISYDRLGDKTTDSENCFYCLSEAYAEEVRERISGVTVIDKAIAKSSGA